MGSKLSCCFHAKKTPPAAEQELEALRDIKVEVGCTFVQQPLTFPHPTVPENTCLMLDINLGAAFTDPPKSCSSKIFPNRCQGANLHPPSLPHQAGIELSDFHARVWKSEQGGRNSMQEVHGNQTKCMEFQPI